MNAAKSELFILICIAVVTINKSFGLGLQCILIYPTFQAEGRFIEQQVSHRLAVAYQQRSVVPALSVILIQRLQVYIRKDVCIMYKYRFVATIEQRLCLLYTSACIEQKVALIAYANIDSEVIIIAQKVYNLLAKVMNIDYYIIKSGGFQS